MRSIARALLASTLLSSLLTAQRTWQVTSATLQATIAAAAPGDVLLVSGGGTVPSLTIDKALHIHVASGSSMVVIAGPLTIRGVVAGRTCVLQDFAASGSVTVRGCAGSVLLAGLLVSRAWIVVEDCLDVSVDRSAHYLGPGDTASLVAVRSSVTVTRLLLRAEGSRAGSSGPSLPALVAISSHVRIVQSGLIGGFSEVAGIAPQPAIQLLASTVRISGAETGVVAGWSASTPVSAIDGNGTLILDPAASLTAQHGAPVVGPGVTVAMRAHPTTLVTRSRIGGTSMVTVRGRAQDACVLLLGLPGLPRTVPECSANCTSVATSPPLPRDSSTPSERLPSRSRCRRCRSCARSRFAGRASPATPRR